MAQTSFSGPVRSENGFQGDVVGSVTATTISATGNASLRGTANVIIIPTVNPAVAGAIWNNAGTLAISAG